MMVLVATLVVMLLVALALSLSVLAGRKPVSGSCGGVGKALGDPNYVCDLCGGDEAKCEAEKQKSTGQYKQPESLAYDASQSSGSAKD